MKPPALLWIFLVFALPVQAAELITSSINSGGGRSSQGFVVNDGAFGIFGGISTTSAVTVKHGYLGQLYDVTELVVTAAPAIVPEGGSSQLAASATMDDGTTLEMNASEIAWSILGGPISGIDPLGVATASLVFEDTIASVRGSFGGEFTDLVLTVEDVDPDNFGSYAGDRIDDDWQAMFFGLGNPDAAPAEDPDGDGQDNLFEFTALLDPRDPLSRFSRSVGPADGSSGAVDVTFGPVFAGRNYVVEASDDLIPANFEPVIGATVTDNGNERTVTDPGSGGPRRFYRIGISKP